MVGWVEVLSGGKDYRSKCCERGAVRRSTIARSLELLDKHQRYDLAGFLEGKLLAEPLEKPPLHKGDVQSDWFEFELDDNFYAVVDALRWIEAIGDDSGSEALACTLLDEWNGESPGSPVRAHS